MFSHRILTAKKKKKNRNNNLQSQLEYRQSPQGVHMSRKRWGELQARLDINHPIPTLHPDSCFQWIVAWHSWYLRAVSNRIGSKLHGTDWPSRLLDCDHPSGRESKTSTKRSARDSPPSLGMHDCRLRSFRVLLVRSRDYRMVSWFVLVLISGFFKKQVDTYVLIYVSYRYLNCAQTAGLVWGKTFPLVIPPEGFVK